jgi:hypothetical protein
MTILRHTTSTPRRRRPLHILPLAVPVYSASRNAILALDVVLAATILADRVVPYLWHAATANRSQELIIDACSLFE